MRILVIIAAIAFKVGFAVYLMGPGLILRLLIVGFAIAAAFAILTTHRVAKRSPELFCAVGQVGGEQAVIPCEFKLRSAESLRYEAPT